MEWREYVPRGSEDKHTKYGNVYYHCRLYCIRLRCPEFVHSQLDVSHVLDNLLKSHKDHLNSEFGLQL